MKQRFESFIASPSSMLGRAMRRAALMLLLSVLTTMTAWAKVSFGISYIDANGNSATCTKADVVSINNGGLDNNNFGSDTGWLVVEDDVTLDGAGCAGTFYQNLILCDGATLTINGKMQFLYTGLSIYGQSGGTGKLVITGDDSGSVLYTYGNLTINGGILEVTNTNDDGSAFRGRSLVMNGGNASFTGGTSGYGIVPSCTFNCKNAADRIKASKYQGTVTIADGKYMKDDSGNVYYGTLTDAQKSAIANVELQPATEAEFAAYLLPPTADEYTISDATDWKAFCFALQYNDTYNRFSGKTVKLGDNIEVSSMAGSLDHDFCGTFDGQGYTLTFDYTTDANDAAPFRYVENGTIKNLHVAGTIITSAKYAAGLIAHQYGAVTIQNCRSSVIIKSSKDGDGTHGGFVAENHGTADITFEGCLFDGKLLSTGATATDRCGGFVGWRSDNDGAVIKVINSLYAPAALEEGEEWVSSSESYTFVRNGIASDITNCYYTAALGTAQGKLRRRIIAGDYVTFDFLALTGPLEKYSVSSIRPYSGGGLMCGSAQYYGKNDPVLFRPNHSDRAGYNFIGFTYSAGNPQGQIIYMPDEDVIISSTWEIIDYSISYELNGGALREGDSNPDSYNVESEDFTLNEPVKDYYEFAGWYTNDAFTGDAVTSIPMSFTGDLTLYAKWTPIPYTISYDLDGGELPADKGNPASYNIESADITLNVPVKEGYKFAGWTGTDLDELTYEVIITTGSTGDREYTATWTPLVSVKYLDADGNEQTFSDCAVLTGGFAMTLPGGCYVVQGTVDFTSNKAYSTAITLNGDVNLILEDGAEMTVNNTEWNGFGIRGDHTLTIFGQSAGTGRLSLTCGAYGNAIEVNNMIVNGGNIIATNTSDGYAAIDVKNLTINRGTVSATSVTTSSAISAISGEVILNDGQLTVSNTCDAGYPYAYSGNLTVNGGQFIASSDYGCTLSATTHFNGGNFSATNTNGAAVDGSMYLNWTSLSDRFYASSFNNISAEIAEGKGFLDEEGNVYQGYYVDDTYYGAVSGLDGKTLRPFNGYYPPQNLIATDIAVTSATLTWEAGNDETQWQVSWSTDGGETWTSPVTVNNTQYEMTDIDPETTFQVQVVSVYSEGQYSYPKSITFTTHSASDAPVELANAVTATTATISWKGFQEKYNVRYAVSLETVEDFENEETFADWTTISNNDANSSGDNGYGRHHDDYNYSFRFSSYNRAEDYNQYLISPELNDFSSMEFNYRGYSSGEVFKVGYSTTGNDVADFTFGDEIMTEDEDWGKYSCILPAGTKYVAIKYYSDYKFYLYVDDITFKSVGSWTNVNNVTSPLTITSLTPETNYLWQVQGILDKDVTEWIGGTFTTDELNLVLYNNGSDALDNASAVSDNNGFVAQDVVLQGRTLYKDGDWNTLCLPFNVTISGSVLDDDNVVAKVLNETSVLNNGELTLNFSDAPATITAGTPFIIKWDNTGEDLVNPVFNAVTINNTPNNVEFTGGTFRGNYAPLEITADNRNDILLLSSGNRLGYAKTDRTIENGKALGACRAYFEIPANGGIQTARQFTLNFGDDEDITGIIEVNTNLTNKTSDAFDLQGRKVENPKKGLYIVNGKKVVIK